MLGVGEVGALFVDEEGRIHLADVLASTQEVAVLSPEGVRLETVGRRGEGPGEFLRLVGLVPDPAGGGGFVAHDAGNGRITWFDATGHVTATRSWDGGTGRWPALLPTHGPLVAREVDYRRAGPGQSERPPPEVHFIEVEEGGEDRRIEGVRGSIPWPDSVECVAPDGSVIAILQVPFAAWGRLPAITSDGWVAMPRPGEGAVDLHPLTGEAQGDGALRTLGRDHPPVPLSDERWAREPSVARLHTLEAEHGGAFGDAANPRSPCPLHAARPESLPPVRSVTPTDDGRLWVESPTAEGFEFALFTTGGTLVGVAPAPERDARVHPFARGDHLYLVAVDALGLQSLEVYRAVEPPAPTPSTSTSP